jgi:hypothetical protein
MWRGFWSRVGTQARDADVQSADLPAPEAEQASRADSALPVEQQAGEVAAFLARFYTHQRC